MNKHDLWWCLLPSPPVLDLLLVAAILFPFFWQQLTYFLLSLVVSIIYEMSAALRVLKYLVIIIDKLWLITDHSLQINRMCYQLVNIDLVFKLISNPSTVQSNWKHEKKHNLFFFCMISRLSLMIFTCKFNIQRVNLNGHLCSGLYYGFQLWLDYSDVELKSTSFINLWR